MAKIAFRFDIDSHKCIRDGVPILLEISKEYDVPFTFFVNFGRAISIWDTLFCRKQSSDNVKMLSALEKLGKKDYLYAAIRNPKMTKYEQQIRQIIDSQCELGIHGGRNHSHWYMHALDWDYKKLYSEIIWSVEMLKKISPYYSVKGFAAPGFVTTDAVDRVLADIGFIYSSNTFADGKKNIINDSENRIIDISVNLCGDPGGIAFWEYAEASGWSDEYTLQNFLARVYEQEKILVFDHPYFAAIKKRKLLEKTIEELINNGHEIVTVNELIG